MSNLPFDNCLNQDFQLDFSQILRLKTEFLKMKKKLIGFLLIASFAIVTFHSAGLGQASEESTNKPSGITLHVLTRHATDVWKPFRNAFLVTQAATDNNVDAIIFDRLYFNYRKR